MIKSNHVECQCLEVSARFNHHFCAVSNKHDGCPRTKPPSTELWTAFLACSFKGSGSIAIFHQLGNWFLTWSPLLTKNWTEPRRISSMAIINGPQRPLGHSWRTIICVRHANVNIVCGRKFILFHWPSPSQFQGFKKQDWGDAMNGPAEINYPSVVVSSFFPTFAKRTKHPWTNKCHKKKKIQTRRHVFNTCHIHFVPFWCFHVVFFITFYAVKGGIFPSSIGPDVAFHPRNLGWPKCFCTLQLPHHKMHIANNKETHGPLKLETRA